MKTLAFALAAVCLASGFASAHPPARRSAEDGPPVLRYAELDLTREQGARVLVGRIKQAAHAFCGPEPRLVSLGEHRRYAACVEESASAAVRRVNAPLVTAAYWGSDERMRLANR
jgi:UrcA family protein